MSLIPTLVPHFDHSDIRLHCVTPDCILNIITNVILLLKSLYVFLRSLNWKCDVTFKDKAVYYYKEYTS